MCEMCDVKFEYLSFYSFDYNSIEKVFVEFKQWLKKHCDLTDSYEYFEIFLNVRLKILNQKINNHFRSYYILI